METNSFPIKWNIRHLDQDYSASNNFNVTCVNLNASNHRYTFSEKWKNKSHISNQIKRCSVFFQYYAFLSLFWVLILVNSWNISKVSVFLYRKEMSSNWVINEKYSGNLCCSCKRAFHSKLRISFDSFKQYAFCFCIHSFR